MKLPYTTSNLLLWLDATIPSNIGFNSSQGIIGAVNKVTGKTIFTSSTSLPTYSASALNNTGGITFNGSLLQYMSYNDIAGNFSGDKPVTIIVSVDMPIATNETICGFGSNVSFDPVGVLLYLDTPGNGLQFQRGNDAGGFGVNQATTGPTPGVNVFTVQYNSSFCTLRLNGRQVYSGAAEGGIATFNTFSIGTSVSFGGNYTPYFTGSIGTILVYDGGANGISFNPIEVEEYVMKTCGLLT